MPLNPYSANLTIAVIGTGTMGRGIVQVAAQGGMRVIAYDEKAGAATIAKEYIGKILTGLVEKGRVTGAEAKATLDRVSVAHSLEDCAKADVVVEAIVERLDIKQSLFQRLDQLCGPDVILASNTSSLPVTQRSISIWRSITKPIQSTGAIPSKIPVRFEHSFGWPGKLRQQTQSWN